MHIHSTLNNMLPLMTSFFHQNKRILPPNIPLDELVFPDKWRGCIHDGSFANYTVRLGPGKQITTHCVVRQIDDTYAAYLNSKAIAELMQCPTFAIFRYQLEGMPETTNHRIHDGGHLSVGGEMSNQYSSASGMRRLSRLSSLNMK